MILQVVGFKDSGKTHLMTQMVAQIKALGYHVTTIKHHGHKGEEIQLPNENVDHMKHFNAGADQSIVQGHAYIETIKRDTKATLETLIADYVTMDNSVILVEGYKQAHYDKVIVYRNDAEYQQLRYLTNVVYALDNSRKESQSLDFERWLQNWVNRHKG